VPARWRARGSQYGTDELVWLITAVGQRVAAELPGHKLGVADLSRAGGGLGPHHRSHQTGRDVDLLFFVTDRSGRSVMLEEMRHFGEDGTTVDGGPPLRFDVRRTWVVVRALATTPGVELEHLFIFAPLRSMLLDHARAIGEPESLVAWAGELLSQPADSAPHDDHLHVRIRCPAGDAGAEHRLGLGPAPRHDAIDRDQDARPRHRARQGQEHARIAARLADPPAAR
jgi:penicillin-insensitive murein endopeptidase